MEAITNAGYCAEQKLYPQGTPDTSQLTPDITEAPYYTQVDQQMLEGL